MMVQRAMGNRQDGEGGDQGQMMIEDPVGQFDDEGDGPDKAKQGSEDVEEAGAGQKGYKTKMDA